MEKKGGRLGMGMGMGMEMEMETGNGNGTVNGRMIITNSDERWDQGGSEYGEE